MSKKPTGSIIYWIRSDLRLNDNIALWEAAKSNKDLIVIYIKDLITDQNRHLQMLLSLLTKTQKH